MDARTMTGRLRAAGVVLLAGAVLAGVVATLFGGFDLDLVRYFGWLGIKESTAEKIVLWALGIVDFGTLIAMIGASLAGLAVRIGWWKIRRYAKMHGYRRAVSW